MWLVHDFLHPPAIELLDGPRFGILHRGRLAVFLRHLKNRAVNKLRGNTNIGLL